VALVLQLIGLLGMVLALAAAAHAVGVGFVVWAVGLLPLFLWQFVPRYRIRGDRLTVHWIWRRSCQLPDVTYASLYRLKSRTGRGPASLVLVVDRRIKIRLADALWCHCHYRPADLRAFADSLARSPHPEARATATWLRWFADDPERPWPAQHVLKPVRRHLLDLERIDHAGGGPGAHSGRRTGRR
jgi:hypothetical protein